MGKWEAGDRETPGYFFPLPTSVEPQAVAISLLVSESAPLFYPFPLSIPCYGSSPLCVVSTIIIVTPRLPLDLSALRLEVASYC